MAVDVARRPAEILAEIEGQGIERTLLLPATTGCRHLA
jgi:hypothetical protein